MKIEKTKILNNLMKVFFIGLLFFFLILFIDDYKKRSKEGNDIKEIGISRVITEGRPFTKNEIDNTLNENRDYILKTVSQELNISPSNIVIKPNGYYHLTAEENRNILSYNFLTLPILVNNRLVGAALIYKYNNEIICSLETGSKHFNKINEILINHPNEKFVMIYIGDSIEAAIGENNEVYFITAGLNVFKDGLDYYNAYKFEANTVDISLLY